MPNDREGNNDPAGYKRPPRRTQFQPGQSGNPRGRRKNVRNFTTDLLDELREQISVRENGRERRISKQRAFIKALVASAIKGDMRATSALVALCSRSREEKTGDVVELARLPTTSISLRHSSPANANVVATTKQNSLPPTRKRKWTKPCC